MIAVHVEVEAEGWERLPDPEGLFRRAVEAASRAAPALAEAARRQAELALLLSDDARMRALNARYRAKDAPTNVLSFPPAPVPGAEAGRFLGDVVLAYETVAREAEEAGKPLADHAAHLALHGVLHLVGYDHETEEEAEAMEGVERAALRSLGIPDPYEPRPEHVPPDMLQPHEGARIPVDQMRSSDRKAR